MAKYSKADAASIAIKCAAQYKSELANKTLLFLCQDKHKRILSFEFSFRERNYMHLTGLIPVEYIDNKNNKHILSAVEFYNKCISKTLQTNQFEFYKDGNTQLKLEVLPKMICKNLSAKMIGDYNTFTPKLQTDKLVGKIDGIMGFDLDKNENRYLPNTLLKADIRNLSTSTVRIIATFRKPINASSYQEITYKVNNIAWQNITLPENLNYLSDLLLQ